MRLFEPYDLSAMRAFSLLLLRVGTGLLLVIWGLLRVLRPNAGPGLAERYYGGIGGAEALQVAFGAAEALIGILVVLGLFRRIVYPLQALILIFGTLAIAKYLVDPFGMWLLAPEDAQILFFPSVTLAAASLALLAFGREDRWAADNLFHRRQRAFA